ncbi:hypothetical protein EAF04_006521 [Stromatinia cepivora]|nr:hypothetical protein EAF04_006521 [Stromatinia cepivora]
MSIATVEAGWVNSRRHQIGNHGAAFEGWKEQNNAPAMSVPLIFFDYLKKCYPTYHVVQSSPDACDLIGYANAGFAVAIRDDEDAYWTLRTYKAPGSRLANKPKTVVDRVFFGKWAYTWEEKDYIVYRAQHELSMGRTTTLQFILTPLKGRALGEGPLEAIDSLILAVGAWTSELHEEIYVFDNQRWGKDKDLYESVKDSSWDEVILDPTMKKNLIADVQGFFDNQALYKKLAVPWKRGIILHGVPGNGKTISIKALMSSLSQRPIPIPSLYIKSFDGECHSQKWSIAGIFQHARKMAPCLLIFEDLDSLVTDKTRSYFLNEVDGLESNDGILMIGSTNHLGRLDPAISRRPSRFDRKYMFRVPDEGERKLYVEFWRRKLAGSGSGMVEFGEEVCGVVAKVTEGFSFAYLKELFVITLLGIARGASGAGDDVEDVSESGTATSTSTSTDDGIVVEKEDSMEGIISEPQSAQTSQETTGAEPATQSNTQRTLPKIDIPEHLKNNIFLNALITQAKILLEDMDNTDEMVVAEKVPGPHRVGGPPPPPPPPHPIQMARMMKEMDVHGAVGAQ